VHLPTGDGQDVTQHSIPLPDRAEGYGESSTHSRIIVLFGGGSMYVMYVMYDLQRPQGHLRSVTAWALATIIRRDPLLYFSWNGKPVHFRRISVYAFVLALAGTYRHIFPVVLANKSLAILLDLGRLYFCW